MAKWLMQMLALIPILVSGIEQIHGETKTGAEKKQIAMDALGLAVNTAEAIDPAQKVVIDAVNIAASSTIDAVKTVYNASRGATPAPKPVLVPPAQKLEDEPRPTSTIVNAQPPLQ